MIYLGICDDDPVYLKQAEVFLEKQADRWDMDASVSSFNTLTELMQATERPDFHMDMLFLDIEFGRETSLDTARIFSSLHPECHIVFLTNYLSYALDVYEIPHLYYVVKDEFSERIPKIFSAFFHHERYSKLTASSGTTTYILELKEIYYIERMRLSSNIITDSGEYRTTELFENLVGRIDLPCMVRCHNSFLVNLQHVKKYQLSKFHLFNGDEIPISRAYQKSVKEQFERWIDIWV